MDQETQIAITLRNGTINYFWAKDLKPAQQYLGVYGLGGIDINGIDTFIQQYAIDSIETTLVNKPE